MKDNSLVFYDPQDGQHWSPNEVFTHSIGCKVTSMRVNSLLFNNELVKELLRMS